MATDAPPIPLHVAERLARHAVANGTPIGPRTVAVLLDELDNPHRRAAVRKGASAELVVLNASLRDELAAAGQELTSAEQDRATVDDARAELACRVDELVVERDQALAEAARLRRELDAVEARDHERARQAMLDHAADGGS